MRKHRPVREPPKSSCNTLTGLSAFDWSACPDSLGIVVRIDWNTHSPEPKPRSNGRSIRQSPFATPDRTANR